MSRLVFEVEKPGLWSLWPLWSPLPCLEAILILHVGQSGAPVSAVVVVVVVVDLRRRRWRQVFFPDNVVD